MVGAYVLPGGCQGVAMVGGGLFVLLQSLMDADGNH